MQNKNTKEYIAVLQCHIVKERCSGYLCERALNERAGGFAGYPKDKVIRSINLTCGGCCGRATHRKLTNLINQLNRQEGITKDKIAVQLSSCITKDNYHGPPCPHLDYLKQIIGKLELDIYDDTVISKKSVQLRQKGLYQS